MSRIAPTARASLQVEAYLRSASPRFQRVFTDVGSLVRRIFPSARPVFEWNMPGWKVPIVPPPNAVQGTIPPDAVAIFLVERKAGITLHLWNPADYAGLEKRAAQLTAAGFKVMRGCLQFNRKAEFPTGPVEDLLKAVRSAVTTA